jgi:hypothetical protein
MGSGRSCRFKSPGGRRVLKRVWLQIGSRQGGATRLVAQGQCHHGMIGVAIERGIVQGRIPGEREHGQAGSERSESSGLQPGRAGRVNATQVEKALFMFRRGSTRDPGPHPILEREESLHNWLHAGRS